MRLLRHFVNIVDQKFMSLYKEKPKKITAAAFYLKNKNENVESAERTS